MDMQVAGRSRLAEGIAAEGTAAEGIAVAEAGIQAERSLAAASVVVAE